MQAAITTSTSLLHCWKHQSIRPPASHYIHVHHWKPLHCGTHTCPTMKMPEQLHQAMVYVSLCMCVEPVVFPHCSCPMKIAMIVEERSPRLPSRACHGLEIDRAVRIRAPLKGLFTMITPETPRNNHSISCKRKAWSDTQTGTKKQWNAKFSFDHSIINGEKWKSTWILPSTLSFTYNYS